jgi:hypothetical protein
MEMFQKAQRKKARLRLCLAGPSGSGKTYSAIKIAMGLSGKIAMIDTEHGSGELYADLTDYDVVSLGAPYSPHRYIECIKQAEKMGYNVLIIDSLSHAWTGEGGVLEMVDNAAKASKSGNSYTAWRDVTPAHNKLVEAILTSNLHIITTLRTKTDYVMETNEKGKAAPRKIGLAPIQRDGMEYEFTIVLDLSIDGHVASASKDRTRLFDGKYEVPSEKTGELLLHWLNSGKSEEEVTEESNRKFSLVIDSIFASDSLEALKEKFKEAKEIYGHDPRAILEIVNAKEARKIDLLHAEGKP